MIEVGWNELSASQNGLRRLGFQEEVLDGNEHQVKNKREEEK